MNMEIDSGATTGERTAADAILIRLREAGVRYLFANAGTDFASIVDRHAAKNLVLNLARARLTQEHRHKFGYGYNPRTTVCMTMEQP